ncbi:MAG: DUF2508 family protein [Firmicutes bacterium]|nr:DUF2508 family protein [Bacillota bacterium]
MKGLWLNQLLIIKGYINEQFQKHNPQPPNLVEMIDQAKEEWEISLNQLNNCDQDMLDYVIHDIHAKERRYMSLLMQARKESLGAWKSDDVNEKFTPEFRSQKSGVRMEKTKNASG